MPASTPTCVLLIDDDKVLLARTKDYLEAKGYAVVTTSNVFAVPSLVGAQRPDLVVLDIRMPALSGSTAASTLLRLYSVPILFYSAVDEEEGQAMAREHRGSVFVSKAHGLRRLHQEMERVVASVRRAP